MVGMGISYAAANGHSRQFLHQVLGVNFCCQNSEVLRGSATWETSEIRTDNVSSNQAKPSFGST